MSHKPWVWGLGVEDVTHKALATLLHAKGVPEELAGSRATAALKVLGHQAVDQALKHRNQWQQLKTLGTQHRFQFLLPSELHQVVQNNKANVGNKTKKQRAKKPPPQAVQLDPERLHIPDGTFRSKGVVMPQIAVNQIGPLNHGVVLCTAEVAEPFLRANKQVSKEPLALIVIGQTPTGSCTLPQSEVTVPCTCAVDREPVLVTGVMFQLGSCPIEKHVAKDILMMETLDVATMKLTIYKDEVAEEWDEVLQAPIRYIMKHFPMLRYCKESGCRCPCWHNPEKIETDDALLDVWWRRHLTLQLRECKAKESEVYSALIRTPTCLRDSVLQVSGTAGVYCEPRSIDGRSIDDTYAIVWCPKLSGAELMHLKQTRPVVQSIARVGFRKGVRVLRDQAAALHSELKPGSTYLQGPRTAYMAGPFPYGSDRRAIGKVLETMNWTARPMHPLMPAGGGNMWLIQATEAPPEPIISTSHGEIVITLHRPTEVTSKPTTTKPVGAAKTLALCEAAGSAKPQEDLLQTYDPWKGYNGPKVPAAPSVTESAKEMEQRIQAAVMAKLPAQVTAAPMERDDIPDRVLALEHQIQQIQGRQQSLETTFTEVSTKQSNQLTSLQGQLNSQGQQLHGQLESQQQHIQAMFESQMQQIRGLLSKRGRDENPMEWQIGLGQVQVFTMLVVFALVCPGCLLFAITISLALCPFLSVVKFWGKLSSRCTTHSSCRIEEAQPRPRGLAGKCRNTSFWLVSILLVCQLRTGEAAHPGPPQPQGTKHDFQFTIGCCNPSGLCGKSEIVSREMASGDIWAISESHLSSRAMHAFRASLKFGQSPFKFCIGGEPTPPRANSEVSGSWKGVAVLSKHPTRAVPAALPDSIAKSSRAAITASFLNGLWITTGVVYGEPESTMYPNHRQHNNRLIQAVVDHVGYLCTGPRIIAGDFNETIGSLPAFAALEAAGFRDIQDLRWERWGIAPQPTSKGKCRRDYLFLSPELQAILTNASVVHDLWPDHAMLTATFWSTSHFLPRSVWQQPSAFAWPSHFEFDELWWSKQSGTPTEKYAAMWKAIEKAAAANSPRQIHKKSMGRGVVHYVKEIRPPAVPPLRPSRKGEILPGFHGTSFRYAQWFRQCRRLQAYARCVKNLKEPSVHAAQLWNSIHTAKGFVPTFADWWKQQPFRTPGCPQKCPCVPPAFDIASAMYDTMVMSLRHFEAELKQQSRQYARQRRAKNPMVIFQDLRDQAEG